MRLILMTMLCLTRNGCVAPTTGQPASGVETITLPPSATVAPSVSNTTVASTPRPATPVTSADRKATDSFQIYRHAAARWNLAYPEWLHPEPLSGNPDVMLFISADRSNLVAIDSYLAEGNAYGNTGEDLRNRARDVLEQMYGIPVLEDDILSEPTAPWETGIRFHTAKGSVGAAYYMQPGRGEGDTRVYGFLYGYKLAREAEMQPLVTHMLASFARDGE